MSPNCRDVKYSHILLNFCRFVVNISPMTFAGLDRSLLHFMYHFPIWAKTLNLLFIWPKKVNALRPHLLVKLCLQQAKRRRVPPSLSIPNLFFYNFVSFSFLGLLLLDHLRTQISFLALYRQTRFKSTTKVLRSRFSGNSAEIKAIAKLRTVLFSLLRDRN